MDNNEKSMSAELIDVEEKKEQFEHEMTQVMLAFKNEVKNLKANDVSEYLEMDIGKAGVEFTPSEFEVKEMQTVSAPELASIEQIKGTEEISVNIAPPEYKAVDIKALSFEDKPVPSVNTEIPQAFKTDFKADADISVSSVETAVIPEVSFTAPSSDYEVSLSLSNTVPAQSVAFASELSQVQVKELDVSVPETGSTAVNAPLSAPDISVSLSEKLPDASVMTDRLVLKETEPQSFSVAAVDTAAPQIPELPKPAAIAEVTAAIPPKPDFTSYYSEIIEAVNAEL